jgi:hypothetical protein
MEKLVTSSQQSLEQSLVIMLNSHAERFEKSHQELQSILAKGDKKFIELVNHYHEQSAEIIELKRKNSLYLENIGQLEKKICDLTSLQVDHDQLKNQNILNIQSRLQRFENSLANRLSDTIKLLQNKNGEVPIGFPASLGELLAMTYEETSEWLDFYQIKEEFRVLPENSRLPAQKKFLCRHLGINV